MTATTVDVAGPHAGTVFDHALQRAQAGLSGVLTVTDDRGGVHHVDVAGWCRDHLPGDRSLLSRCAGPTLDVGCGPGRLTGALNRLGHPALGIDVSATAVRLARARGAIALRRDVFAALPGHGRWRHVMLADGNIGIGGDPETLLRRCRTLIAPIGRIHVELAPPGTRSWAGTASLHDGSPDGSGDRGAPFRWAVVAVDDIGGVADAAALRVHTTWMEAQRWFATLIPA